MKNKARKSKNAVEIQNTQLDHAPAGCCAMDLCGPEAAEAARQANKPKAMKNKTTAPVQVAEHKPVFLKVQGQTYTVAKSLADYISEIESAYQFTIQCNAELRSRTEELLQALQALFDHCVMLHKHWGEDSNQKSADAAIAFARAAIQQAQGGQP